jgi:hypothetical protein
MELFILMSPSRLVTINQTDLNESNRARRGDSRKNVLAETLMPEFVYGQA